MLKHACLLLTAVTIPVSDVGGQIYRQQGTAVGGLAGAAAGAAIGEHNDNPLAGAMIGGALGLMTGSAIGGARDQEVADSRARYHYQQQANARRLSPQDAVTMTHNGVGDSVIINYIRTNGVQQRLQVADVIALHQQGVSEPVISAMQSAMTAPVVAAPVYRHVAQPVFLEHAPAPRLHFGWHRGFRRPRHFRHRHGPSLHFSFGR